MTLLHQMHSARCRIAMLGPRCATPSPDDFTRGQGMRCVPKVVRPMIDWFIPEELTRAVMLLFLQKIIEHEIHLLGSPTACASGCSSEAVAMASCSRWTPPVLCITAKSATERRNGICTMDIIHRGMSAVVQR